MDHFQSWVFLLIFLWHSTPLVEFCFFVVAKRGLEVFILVIRLRARALVELASSQENLGVSPGSEWPAPPPSVPQARESLLQSFLRSVRSHRAEGQARFLQYLVALFIRVVQKGK